jgi:hypothetical protein
MRMLMKAQLPADTSFTPAAARFDALVSPFLPTTGSARGIGRAIAERYEQLSASVVVNYSERHREGDVAASRRGDQRKRGSSAEGP